MDGVPRVDPVIVQREQEEAVRAIKERLGILEEQLAKPMEQALSPTAAQTRKTFELVEEEWS